MKGSYSVSNITYPLSTRIALEKTFFEKNKKFNFKKIELLRLEQICTAAYEWDDTTFYENNIDRESKLLYQLIHHKTQFQLNSINERLLFYMFVMDGDFKLLHILMEESDLDSIKNRCFQEGIIYTPALLNLESHYNKIFNIVEDIYAPNVQRKKL